MSKKINYKRRRLILYYCILIFVLLLVLLFNLIKLGHKENKVAKKIGNGIEGEDENIISNDIVSENIISNEIELVVTNGNVFGNRTWNLILVNSDNRLSKEYKPELEEIEEGFKVDKRIINDLKEMLKDARKEGLKPWICSAYRDYETQEKLFTKQVNEYLDKGYTEEEAKSKTVSWILEPGSSEHATGLALDIVDKKYQLLDEKQAEREVQKWLMENCYKYGFILRYPENKKDITKVDYEPWHYRYVGKEHAKKIYSKNYTLEEYIDYLNYYGK